MCGRQRIERRVEDRIEQVSDSGEGERRLAFCRSCLENAQPASFGGGNACSPERGLPHASLAFKDERSRSLGNACEEGLKLGELGVAAGDGAGHGYRSYACARASNRRELGDTAGVGYTIFRQSEVKWVPRGDDDPRTIAALSDALSESRANIWRYPPGARGRRHKDLAQEEVFVVLDGTLTVDLGDPPERHVVERGGVVVVEVGTVLQLRNAGDEELVLFIYGAPPVHGQGEFFPDVP